MYELSAAPNTIPIRCVWAKLWAAAATTTTSPPRPPFRAPNLLNPGQVFCSGFLTSLCMLKVLRDFHPVFAGFGANWTRPAWRNWGLKCELASSAQTRAPTPRFPPRAVDWGQRGMAPHPQQALGRPSGLRSGGEVWQCCPLHAAGRPWGLRQGWRGSYFCNALSGMSGGPAEVLQGND